MKLSDIPFLNPEPGDEETHVLIYRKGDEYIVTCQWSEIPWLLDTAQDAVNTAMALGEKLDMPVRRLRTYEDRRLIDRLREWIDVPTWPSWLRF